VPEGRPPCPADGYIRPPLKAPATRSPQDWHYASEFPETKAYALPGFFRDDWLNGYLLRDSGEPFPGPGGAGVGWARGGGAGGGAPAGGPADVALSDYRFVYVGPKGSWTPLHADVVRSYSWSANVCGRKRWRLLPPPLCGALRPGRLTEDFPRRLLPRHAPGCPRGEALTRAVAGQALEAASRHPPGELTRGQLERALEEEGEVRGVGVARPRDVGCGCELAGAGAGGAPGAGTLSECCVEALSQFALEVEQGAGEAIFVPAAWHHDVENLADTLSINHNWLNGFGVLHAVRMLLREHDEAAAGIEDCRGLCGPAEFQALVARNVEANAGFDLCSLGALLVWVLDGALESLAARGERAGAGRVVRFLQSLDRGGNGRPGEATQQELLADAVESLMVARQACDALAMVVGRFDAIHEEIRAHGGQAEEGEGADVWAWGREERRALREGRAALRRFGLETEGASGDTAQPPATGSESP